MKKWGLLIVCLIIIGAWFFKPFEQPSESEITWHEELVWEEIESSNQSLQAELAAEYSIYVNDLFIDLGYQWDDQFYVPVLSIAYSLNFHLTCIPETGSLRLVKGEEEFTVEIKDILGKGYARLTELEKVLAYPRVEKTAKQIAIFTASPPIEQIERPKEKLAFFINNRKMTEAAFTYLDKEYVPARIFALACDLQFRLDAEKGKVYIEEEEIDPLFVQGRSYASLQELKKFIDSTQLEFEFKKTSSPNELWPLLSKGPEKKVVALTFDDYLSSDVEPLLAILKEHQVSATFFLIGNSLAGNHDLLKTMAAEGHALANHTWDHLNLYTLTTDEIRAQIIAPLLKMEQLGVKPAPFFRPPGGFYNETIIRIAQEAGLKTVLWSLNSFDGDPANSAFLVKDTVCRWVHPGAIVALHTSRPATIQALPGIIKNLRSQGYDFVTLPELWALDRVK